MKTKEDYCNIISNKIKKELVHIQAAKIRITGHTYATFQGSGPRTRKNVNGFKVPAPT